mmetsp:Transcript_45550/g.89768  ORF Transcript_45550/g.89768 Transcript_45550/m.89768 type:complete len:89 (+) Transcript_45550:271-537(+)
MKTLKKPLYGPRLVMELVSSLSGFLLRGRAVRLKSNTRRMQRKKTHININLQHEVKSVEIAQWLQERQEEQQHQHKEQKWHQSNETQH